MSEDPTLFADAMTATVAFVTLLPGALISLTPWLQRRREAFAVTVPASAHDDPALRRYRVAFTAAMLVVTVASAVAAYLTFTTDLVAYVAVVCLVPLAGFLLMLHFRARVAALKRERGWHATRAQASALVSTPATTGEVPQALPLAWNLLYVPLVVATLALSAALYPSMPEQVPMHMNAAGVIDGYVEKGWAVLVAPALIQVFLALCMAASHYLMVRSKRPASTEAPAATALAYGMFAQAQSVALLVCGLLVTAAIAFMPLTFAGIVGMGQAVVVILVASVAACVPCVAVSVVYGQSGSRLLRRLAASGELVFDDDACWKAGVFYVNRDDPAVVLPKRFGVGWAMNWGNPRAWLLAGVLAALCAAFVAGIGLLLG